MGAMDGELEPRLQEEELRLLSFPESPVGYRTGGQGEVNLPLLGRERTFHYAFVQSCLMIKEGCLC